MTAIATPDREQVKTLLRRLRRDRVEWARRCFRILDKHGHVIPLVANPAQLLVYQAEQRQLAERGFVRSYTLKARQGGISTWEQASNVHQVWSEPGFNAITLAHIREATDTLFGITQRGIDHFPRSLLWRLGPKNTREISFPGLLTKFWTGTAGATRTGRSLTLKRVHGSEFAFWDNPRATLNALTPALVPNGSIISLETTASAYDSEPHNHWREAEEGANGYVAIFIPWWLCDVKNYRLPLMAGDELGTLEPDEADLVERHGLDLEQVKWRRFKVREMGRGAFLQEYAEDAESCWAAAGGMFYDAELLKGLLARAPQPLYTVHTAWGAVEVFEEPVEGERTVGGCDTAEGFTVGEVEKKDRSTFTVRSFPERRLKLKFESRSITPEDLAGLLGVWGRTYRVYWVVEKNAHGITTLRKMRDVHKYPLSGIYHRRPADVANTKESASELIGWHTNEGTKGLLLDYGRTLLNAARDGIAGVPTLAALRDGFAVRRDDKGKINLNGRDVLVSEMLCEVGHQSVPPQRQWWLGPT